MAEDKLIKSGQLTIPRILFLVVVGGIIVAAVAKGGVYLSVGYWLLTVGLCVLLFLIAIDYGVQMEKVGLSPQSAPGTPALEAQPAVITGGSSVSAPRPKKRGGRPAKRRR
ncbi:MAG TPA: hypothetical protein VJH03_22520 [Blastocatellia bacterium]|nr:hypothetical protein [Blastocatellia bacterium]